MNHAGTMAPSRYSPEGPRAASGLPVASWSLVSPNLAGVLPVALSPQAVMGRAKQEGL